MKSLIWGLLTLGSLTLTAGTYAFPGWDCKDEAKIKTAIANAKNGNQKAESMILLGIKQKNIKTYAELCKEIDRVCDEVYAVPKQRESQKVTFKKQFPFCRGQFIPEAWEFARKNPSWYDYYLCLAYRGNPTQCYQTLLNTLLRYDHYYYTPANHVAGVKKLVELGKTAKIASTEADFQKLLKKYQSLRGKKTKALDQAINQIEILLKK